MLRARWRNPYSGSPHDDCWLHSTHVKGTNPWEQFACITMPAKYSGELSILVVPLDQVTILRRLPQTLEEN